MLFLGLIKGASADWWNYMHNQHHAKPNVIDVDPDCRLSPFFVLGEIDPKRVIHVILKYYFLDENLKSLHFLYNRRQLKMLKKRKISSIHILCNIIIFRLVKTNFLYYLVKNEFDCLA